MEKKNREELKANELNGEELDQVTGGVYVGPCFLYHVDPKPLVENEKPVIAAPEIATYSEK